MTETQAGGSSAPRAGESGRPGGLARLSVFLRQVVAELKKVVRPTRTELLTYTSVVLVFVLAVMVYVGVLDLAFGQIVLWVFGG